MIKKETIRAIKSSLHKGHLLEGVEDRLCYSYDATGREAMPDLVVKAGDAGEIASMVKIASRENIPVIPRGSGTGFAGGSVPIKGGIVLVLTEMNRILEIDEDNLIAVVEPGVLTHSLQQQVEEVGLFYPPDPASLKISTLGGNAATCAGGPRAVKYGVTKDYVLGLDVILPDGELLHTGGKCTKSSAGYDLTKLIVGSEGTLGIITKLILRLLPLPETVQTMLAYFYRIDDAANAVRDIIASKIIPSTIEFMDQSAIKCVEDYLEPGISEKIEALLLIELDGDEQAVKKQTKIVETILAKNRVKTVNTAKDQSERERLWKARRSLSPALGRLRPTKINQDIAVPRSRLPEMVRILRKIADDYRLLIVNFGHAGDGNIHVNIMTDARDKEEMVRAETAVRDIFTAALKLGGTISGEHGIGISKSGYLEQEIGSTGIWLSAKIKSAVDPKNIMNPGKIFSSLPTFPRIRH